MMKILDRLFPGRVLAAAAYRDGLWLCEHRALERFLSAQQELQTIATATDIRAAMAAPSEPYRYDINSGAAIIPIAGMMVPKMTAIDRLYSEWFGIEMTDMASTAATIRAASGDAKVSSIQLLINSPGGTVQGTQALAEAVKDAAATKSVRAHIDGMGASAAYWVASQADEVTATETSIVGSIGVVGTALDQSGMFAAWGLKQNVLRSGPNKGTGTRGAPITEEQLQPLQANIDAIARIFFRSVQEGRALTDEQLSAVTDGRTWDATTARDLGLIDGLAMSVGAAGPTNQNSKTEALADSSEQAAFAATEENDMSDKDLAALRAELAEAKEAAAKAKADAEAAKELAALHAKAANEAAKTSIIEAAVKDGRVTPALRASVDAVAAKLDPETLRQHLALLPQQTRPQAQGTAGQQAEALSDSDLTNLELFGLTAEQLAAANTYGDASAFSLASNKVVRLNKERN